MGEAKAKLLQVVIDREEYDILVVRSVFLTALMTVVEDSPEIGFWEAHQAAKQLLEEKAAETE